MKEYLFSYGTLQKVKLQKELFGRKLQGTKDKLAGYKLLEIEIKDEDFLARGESRQQLTLVHTKGENDFISGTAFEVTPAELLVADQYEPAGYHRLLVPLASGKNAWVYISG